MVDKKVQGWRFFTVLTLLCLLFFLLRRLYRAIYHEPRMNAISRDLSVLYNDYNAEDDDTGGGESDSDEDCDTGGAGDTDNDSIGDSETAANDNCDRKRKKRRVTDMTIRRDKILRLRERLGVGVDSLPIVRFSASKVKGSDDEDNDEDALLRERQRECLTHGAFVSEQDEFVDCRTYCNLSDGVTYRYYDKLGSILNGRRGRVGGYCLPNDAAVCNTNTSLVVYGRDGWRCLPQTRAFAGEGGNRIVACDGRLLDRAAGRLWHGHIDSTLAFDSIDEPLVGGTGEKDYRFVCPPSRDDRDNLRIEAPFDRLFLLENTCASLIPHASPDIRPNFQDDSCDCGEHAVYDYRLGTCVPLPNGETKESSDVYEPRTMTTMFSGGTRSSEAKRLGVASCWEPWMTISQANAIAEKFNKDARLSPAATMCGVSWIGGGGEANVAYVRRYGAMFDRLVPSPAAMLLSAPSVASGSRPIAPS